VRVVLALAALTGCFSAPTRPAAGDGGSDMPAAWLEGFAHRKKITIRRAASSQTLTDFMVSIDVAADLDLMASARPQGADITFTRADGTTPVLHELVDYKSISGGFDAWLRFAELRAGDTDIYMYYGGLPNASLSPWPVAYRGVWHLAGKQPTGETDSIGSVSDLSPSAPIEQPGVADGIAGRARDYQFNGNAAEGDELCTTTDKLDFGMASLSYSMWLNVRSNNSDFDSPFTHGGNNLVTPGFGIELGIAPWAAGISDGGGAQEDAQETTIGTPLLNQWMYLVIAIDRSPAPGNVRIYVNGERRITDPIITTIGSLSSSAPSLLCIGSETSRLDGLIDEVQIRAGIWSDEEITAQYQNLGNRVAFQTVGPEETAP